MRRLRAALAEPRSEVLGLVAEGSTVVLRVRLTGVHVGEIVGAAPTRRHVNVEQIHFYEGRDGQLATHHYIRDDLVLPNQLGVRADPPAIASPQPDPRFQANGYQVRDHGPFRGQLISGSFVEPQ